MSQATEDFKDLLIRNRGKLKSEHMPKIITFIDSYLEEFAVAGEKALIQRLLGEALDMDPQRLQDVFECGTHALASFKDDFTPLIPDGLGKLYVQWLDKTEPPPSFNFFSFLTMVGALLGRQCWMDQQIFKVQPSIVTLLVGPQSVRKTSSANFALKLGYGADPDRLDRFEKITSEKLHSRLAQKNPATGVLFLPEMTTVINKKDYQKTMIADLTNLWDNPDNLPVETMGRQEVLRNVGLSSLMCSNERLLIQNLPADAFGGGFFSRILPIYEPVPDPERLFPVPAPMNESLQKEIIYGLVETARIKGLVQFTRAGEKLYAKYYRSIRRNVPLEPNMANWVSRMATGHLPRLAMLISICENRPEHIYVDDTHIQKAYDLLQWMCGRLPKLFNLLGTSGVGEDSQKVMNAVIGNGGRISRTKLTNLVYGVMSARQLDDHIRTLKQAGLIAQVEGGLFDESEPTTYYRLVRRGDS